MSSRWQREAAAGNPAAVKYAEDLGSEALARLDNYPELEKRTMEQAAQVQAKHEWHHSMDARAYHQIHQRQSERRDEESYRDTPAGEFRGGVMSVIRMALGGFEPPRRVSTWGDWAEALQAMDSAEKAAKTPADPNDYSHRARGFARSVRFTERELARDPGWGRVVSRDHRERETLDTRGAEAAAPERAQEAASLFQELLAAPQTETIVVCQCGAIQSSSRIVCQPVEFKVPRQGGSYLKLSGAGTSLHYLSREDQRKALQSWKEANPDESPRQDLGHILAYQLGEAEVTDTYK